MQAHEPREKLLSWWSGFKRSFDSLTKLQTVVITILIVLLAAGALVSHLRSRPEEIEVTGSSFPGRAAGTLTVHVSGAVGSPGLYDLDEGSRVADALEAAGGPAPDASLDNLNLASRVEDGQKITVPSVDLLHQVDGTGDGNTGTVNLNTAGEDELQTLPGIGESLASRIVDYRKQHGNFSSPEELLEVEGIGTGKLEALRDRVSF